MALINPSATTPAKAQYSHRRRFELYRALAETLEAKFTGASEYKAREDAKGWYAA